MSIDLHRTGSRLAAGGAFTRALLLAALWLALSSAGAWAQSNHDTVIVRPAATPTSLAGTVRVDFKAINIPAGWVLDSATVSIYYMPGHALAETGSALLTGNGNCGYEWVSANAFWGPYPQSGLFNIEATTTCRNTSTGQLSTDATPAVITNCPANSPSPFRHAAAAKLQNSSRRDAVCTGSMTSPLTGAQSFEVPFTSWQFKGETFGFGLSYNTYALVDPQEQKPPEFDGLGSRFSRFHQPYAQYLDLWQDELWFAHYRSFCTV